MKSREDEVHAELRRTGIRNVPCPEKCPRCGSELAVSSGYAGEDVAYCPNDRCDAGIVWEDSEDAIRGVL